jgi:hypothetical protein
MARTPVGLNSLSPSSSPSSAGPNIIPARVKFVFLNGKDYPTIGQSMENTQEWEVFYMNK